MIYVILFVHNHWWRRIVDLAAWLPLVAPWVVIMTTHVATGGCGADGLTTFDFRWRYGFTIYHDVYVCVLLYLQMYSYVNLSNKRLLNLNLNLKNFDFYEIFKKSDFREIFEQFRVWSRFRTNLIFSKISENFDSGQNFKKFRF